VETLYELIHDAHRIRLRSGAKPVHKSLVKPILPSTEISIAVEYHSTIVGDVDADRPSRVAELYGSLPHRRCDRLVKQAAARRFPLSRPFRSVAQTQIHRVADAAYAPRGHSRLDVAASLWVPTGVATRGYVATACLFRHAQLPPKGLAFSLLPKPIERAAEPRQRLRAGAASRGLHSSR
jgi:hypothetical protein